MNWYFKAWFDGQVALPEEDESIPSSDEAELPFE